MGICREQLCCVVCGAGVVPVLDLNRQPLANALLEAPGDPFDVYPLGLARCPACSHAQLTHFVDPNSLFGNYLYASGTSRTLRDYFAWFAKALRKAMPAAKTALDIASNDGSLLACLAGAGFAPTGIDPASNLNEIATRSGCRVITGFFPDAVPAETFNVVIAMNVAAHTPDPLGFMNGVRRVLSPGGVAFVQTSQAMMLGNGEFDTIYHEHHSFFTVASMGRLAEQAGLRVARVDLVSVHGTSAVFTLRRAAEADPPAAIAAAPPFAVAWPSPEPAYMGRSFPEQIAAAAYERFATDAKRLMADTVALLDKQRSAGRKVALVGVAAKALTFIRAAGIAPDYFLDEAELKIGRFVPGAPAPIALMSAAAEIGSDCVFLIGAWNFADEITRKLKAARKNFGSVFVTYLPELRVFQ